ncbi:hypothetical protein B9Z55_020992 [Caenorhabditis nigoni]|uniref:Uncharacterized protein n=1 Tax=Caenorhabditis nigoni TaxID=1611254 RepID=A0A2G5TQ35_9PELO|nr:hypothetical protein B9Z55_020992 [Caenorhabditis nigoni]
MHYSLIDPIQIQALPSMFLTTTLSIFPMSYIIFMPPYFDFCFGKPKNEVTRFMKAKLKIGSTVVVAVQSGTVVYPLNTI